MLDPRAITVVRSSAPRFELKLHHVSPEDIIPNGDRYVVEVIDIDEMVELGQLLVVTQDQNINPKDPMANPQVEQRGVIVGVVISKGNGHLLGLADHAVVTKSNYNSNPSDRIEKVPADVPMFYAPGDIVFIDRNAKGRALRIATRECRIANQIDILAHLRGVKLVRNEDGAWEQVEA